MNDSLLEAPRLKSLVELDGLFIPRKMEGEKLNIGMISLVGTSANKLLQQSSSKLKAGANRTLSLRGSGVALECRFGSDINRIALYDGVCCWGDLEKPERRDYHQPSEHPILPTIAETRNILATQTRARSCSFQRINSGDWEHYTFDPSLKMFDLESTALLLLQVDVLIREQKFPRGRMRVEWENMVLWFWICEMEKLIMITAHADHSARDSRIINACGEAFQIA